MKWKKSLLLPIPVWLPEPLICRSERGPHHQHSLLQNRDYERRLPESSLIAFCCFVPAFSGRWILGSVLWFSSLWFTQQWICDMRLVILLVSMLVQFYSQFLLPLVLLSRILNKSGESRHQTSLPCCWCYKASIKPFTVKYDISYRFLLMFCIKWRLTSLCSKLVESFYHEWC